VTDPLDEQYVKDELEKKAELDEQDEEDRQRRRMMSSEKKEDKRLAAILGIVDNSLLAAENMQKHEELMAMQYIPSSYYVELPDTKYEETVVLKDADLPDNRKARRQSVSQQLLHQELVNLQYEKK
jgi:hypothetical protein